MLDLRDIEADKRPGLQEPINILEGWMVLSECLLPGRLPWTWSRFMSELDETLVLFITSSTETEVLRDSNLRHGGRCGYPIGWSKLWCNCILIRKKKKFNRKP